MPLTSREKCYRYVVQQVPWKSSSTQERKNWVHQGKIDFQIQSSSMQNNSTLFQLDNTNYFLDSTQNKSVAGFFFNSISKYYSSNLLAIIFSSSLKREWLIKQSILVIPTALSSSREHQIPVHGPSSAVQEKKSLPNSELILLIN